MGKVDELLEELCRVGVSGPFKKVSLLGIECVVEFFIDIHNFRYVSKLALSRSPWGGNLKIGKVQVVSLYGNEVRLVVLLSILSLRGFDRSL